MRICVYCASSQLADPVYREAATELGALLAEGGHTLVYGGGGTGSMGAVADGALAKGGEVIGIMPHFLLKRELGHKGVTRQELVADMHERKHKLLTDSDAVVALPGGCGTLEELLEAITLKRLGQYHNPIVMLNTRNFYTPLEDFLAHVINERFMTPEHTNLWQLVAQPVDVLPAIANAMPWDEAKRSAAMQTMVGD